MSSDLRSARSQSLSLIKVPPLVLYEISTDIQVSEKWKRFAFAVGFSAENVIMIEMSNNDRFPAENVMFHWFSMNPKVDDLASVLCDLNLERSLHRLKKFMSADSFHKYEQILKGKRQIPSNNEINLQFYEENHVDEISVHPPIENQISLSSTNSLSSPTTPEPGLVSIDLHLPSVPRSAVSNSPTKEILTTKIDIKDENVITTFEKILKVKSCKFSIDEFEEDDFCERFIDGKFMAGFPKKMRGNMFQIQSFSLQKLSESRKNQRTLYNIVWSLTKFRLYSLPIISGYCFFGNYLFLIYPEHNSKSLFDILHRPHINNNEIISSKERLTILRIVGEALSFLHCSIPYGACHGQVNSHNVLVGPNITLLSGFEKFYTEDVDYLKGLSKLSKSEINIEEYYQRDIHNYLELICETWWNIQPYKKDASDESLIQDIKNDIRNLKIGYPGWRPETHQEVQQIICNYSSNSKIIPKIQEIVDDLVRTDVSFEPPSYYEMESIEKSNFQ